MCSGTGNSGRDTKGLERPGTVWWDGKKNRVVVCGRGASPITSKWNTNTDSKKKPGVHKEKKDACTNRMG